LSIVDSIDFDDTDKSIIIDLKSKLSTSLKSDFETKYLSWKNTWNKPEISYSSNFKDYAKSIEYNDFITFCKGKDKKIYSLIYEKFFQGDFFAINAIEELTLPSNGNLVDEVHNENNKKQFDNQGRFIIYTIDGNCRRYLKKLLKKDIYIEKDLKKSDETDKIVLSNFQMYPNPALNKTEIYFELNKKSKLLINILDLNGRLCKEVCSEFAEIGKKKITIDLSNITPGTYLIKILYENNIKIANLIII
jgi:hypothetical protein